MDEMETWTDVMGLKSPSSFNSKMNGCLLSHTAPSVYVAIELSPLRMTNHPLRFSAEKRENGFDSSGPAWLILSATPATVLQQQVLLSLSPTHPSCCPSSRHYARPSGAIPLPLFLSFCVSHTSGDTTVLLLPYSCLAYGAWEVSPNYYHRSA